MKTIVASGRFRKDIKKYSNKAETMKKLYEIIKILEEGRAIPQRHKPHSLIGDYKGFMECHVENDTLLIWLDESSDTIKLVRFGSHSELFR